MDITIYPGILKGTISAPSSKSQAHRVLICAAFSNAQTKVYSQDTNDDIEATADCLRQLGAVITRNAAGYIVTPVNTLPETATMNCRESGSTLRFLLPIVAALGVDTTFYMDGRLPERPLAPLWSELERMGCRLTRTAKNAIRCQGKLSAGNYTIDGSISSQFVSGLLFAMALLPGTSTLKLTGSTVSAPYIALTKRTLTLFGVDAENYCITGKDRLASPGEVYIEGDWSNAAFFLAANKLGNDVTVENLNQTSAQGDRAVTEILQHIHKQNTISAVNTPDLIPILSIVAAATTGAVFTETQRLRTKESDRVHTIAAMLQGLGCLTIIHENRLIIEPGSFNSCSIEAAGDHRIAMSAAIAATVANGPITILGAECVAKSYPNFWRDFQNLGGTYEQYIR